MPDEPKTPEVRVAGIREFINDARYTDLHETDVDAYITAEIRDAARQAALAGFLAGFMATCEGFNAECCYPSSAQSPAREESADILANEEWAEIRDSALHRALPDLFPEDPEASKEA